MRMSQQEDWFRARLFSVALIKDDNNSVGSSLFRQSCQIQFDIHSSTYVKLFANNCIFRANWCLLLKEVADRARCEGQKHWIQHLSESSFNSNSAVIKIRGVVILQIISRWQSQPNISRSLLFHSATTATHTTQHKFHNGWHPGNISTLTCNISDGASVNVIPPAFNLIKWHCCTRH